MRGLGANQVVASIVGWPDNYVMRGEYFECAVRPARPTTSPSDATTGTSSSQIRDVPNSVTQRLTAAFCI